jgi:hypothetical protein
MMGRLPRRYRRHWQASAIALVRLHSEILNLLLNAHLFHHLMTWDGALGQSFHFWVIYLISEFFAIESLEFGDGFKLDDELLKVTPALSGCTIEEVFREKLKYFAGPKWINFYLRWCLELKMSWCLWMKTTKRRLSYSLHLPSFNYSLRTSPEPSL